MGNGTGFRNAGGPLAARLGSPASLTLRLSTRWTFRFLRGLRARGLFASLRGRALVLVLVALLPAVALMLYASAEWRKRAVAEQQDDLLRFARLVSANEQRLVEGASELLIALAHIPDVRRPDPGRCPQVLSTLLAQAPRYANLGVIGTDGQVLCSALPLDPAVRLDGRSHVRRAIETRAFALGDYETAPLSGMPELSFAYPLVDGAGRVEVVLFAAIDLAWLNKLAADAHLPQGSTVTVFDEHGTILAREPDPKRWVGRSGLSIPVIGLILQQRREGTALSAGADGVARLYGFQPLLRSSRAGNMYVAVGMPAAAVLAGIDRISARHFVGLGVVTLLAFATAWIGSELLLLRRLKALVTAANRLRTGDLSARTGLPHGPGELNQLARAFDEMATALRAREAEAAQAREARLREHERLEIRVQERTAELLELNRALHAEIAERERAEAALRKLSSAVEQTADSVFVTDRNGVIEYVNPAFEKLTGYRAEEVVGKTPRFLRSTEHEAEFYERLWDTILDGRVHRAVFVNQKRDGSLYSEQKTITPIRDSHGQTTHFVSAGRDITEQRRAEEALRKSEERHRLLLEASPDPIVVWDRARRPTYVNSAFVQAFGWTHEELLDQPMEFVPEENRPETDEAIERTLTDGDQPFSFASKRFTKDGRRLDVQVNAAVFHDKNGSPQETIVTYRDISLQKRGEAALRRLNTALEQEVRRIAHALHDDAGQFLAALHVALEETAHGLPPAAHDRFQEARGLLDQMEEQLRRLARELRPPVLDDLGLIPALQFLARSMSKRTGLAIVVEGARGDRLPPVIETALYRIVQESLTNVSKHARATRVTIAVEHAAKRVGCSIRDDGIGFDVPAVLAHRGERGLGLIGIQERLDALGGSLSIISAPGRGTELLVTIATEA
jgi:PAS domain S-box-containing protein